jgi:hypothetical protein
MYGTDKPTGVVARTYTLDPTGNCETAEAARRVLSVYAEELAKSPHKRLRDEADAVGKWIFQETVYAENMKSIAAQNEC